MILYYPQSISLCPLCGEFKPLTVNTYTLSRLAKIGVITDCACKVCNRLRNIRRRTEVYNRPYNYRARDWQYALDYFGGRCAVCGSSLRLSADHWLPLSSPNSLGTVPSNIVPLCFACNNDKGSSDPILWLYRRLGHDALVKLTDITAFISTTRQLRTVQ